MAISLAMDYTGLTMLHLTKNMAAATYSGNAYLLAAGHQPRMAIPARNIANLGTADITVAPNATYPPGGPLIAEFDLTGLIAQFEGAAGVGVSIPTLTRPPKDAPASADEWKDVGYLVDLKYLGGTSEIDTRVAAQTARFVLDRGELVTLQPKDEPLSKAKWDLFTPDKKATRTHMLSGVARILVKHTRNDIAILLHDFDGKLVGRVLLQPVKGEEASPVPLAIFSMCEIGPPPKKVLKDVALYGPLLRGGPTVHPPEIHTGYISGDTGQCPPGTLIP
jgi:hypothetical protein